MNYLWNQGEQGISCPVTMTFAGVHVLRNAPPLAAEWEPKLVARAYDPRLVPLAGKAGATLGMAMTEKQGGSDLRANSTLAVRDGAQFRLTGIDALFRGADGVADGRRRDGGGRDRRRVQDLDAARRGEALGQLEHLQHGVLGGDDHGITQHARLVALDLGHMGTLLLWGEVLVHDADAALLRDRDREA